MHQNDIIKVLGLSSIDLSKEPKDNKIRQVALRLPHYDDNFPKYEQQFSIYKELGLDQVENLTIITREVLYVMEKDLLEWIERIIVSFSFSNILIQGDILTNKLLRLLQQQSHIKKLDVKLKKLQKQDCLQFFNARQSEIEEVKLQVGLVLKEEGIEKEIGVSIGKFLFDSIANLKTLNLYFEYVYLISILSHFTHQYQESYKIKNKEQEKQVEVSQVADQTHGTLQRISLGSNPFHTSDCNNNKVVLLDQETQEILRLYFSNLESMEISFCQCLQDSKQISQLLIISPNTLLELKVRVTNTHAEYVLDDLIETLRRQIHLKILEIDLNFTLHTIFYKEHAKIEFAHLQQFKLLAKRNLSSAFLMKLLDISQSPITNLSSDISYLNDNQVASSFIEQLSYQISLLSQSLKELQLNFSHSSLNNISIQGITNSISLCTNLSRIRLFGLPFHELIGNKQFLDIRFYELSFQEFSIHIIKESNKLQIYLPPSSNLNGISINILEEILQFFKNIIDLSFTFQNKDSQDERLSHIANQLSLYQLIFLIQKYQPQLQKLNLLHFTCNSTKDAQDSILLLLNSMKNLRVISVYEYYRQKITDFNFLQEIQKIIIQNYKINRFSVSCCDLGNLSQNLEKRRKMTKNLTYKLLVYQKFISSLFRKEIAEEILLA